MAYNILIVDDSEVTRNIMARTLKMCGVDIGEIYFAENGQVGMEQLGKAWPEYGILRYQHAGDGRYRVRERIIQIRGMEGSARCHRINRRKSDAYGRAAQTRVFKGYIRKPFTAEQVAEIIDQLLGKDQHV